MNLTSQTIQSILAFDLVKLEIALIDKVDNNTDMKRVLKNNFTIYMISYIVESMVFMSKRL